MIRVTVITYDVLNDLVHDVAREIEKATGLSRAKTLDLFALNDVITEYLNRYGVRYQEEEDD
jgi:hypothetical protein